MKITREMINKLERIRVKDVRFVNVICVNYIEMKGMYDVDFVMGFIRLLN